MNQMGRISFFTWIFCFSVMAAPTFEEAIKAEIAEINTQRNPELICHSDLIGNKFRIIVLDSRVKPETLKEYEVRSKTEDDGLHVQFRGYHCQFEKGEMSCPQVDLANIVSRSSKNIDTGESLQSEIFHLHFSESGARNSMLLYLNTVIDQGKRETKGRYVYSPLSSKNPISELETLTQCPVFPQNWIPPKKQPK